LRQRRPDPSVAELPGGGEGTSVEIRGNEQKTWDVPTLCVVNGQERKKKKKKKKKKKNTGELLRYVIEAPFVTWGDTTNRGLKE